MTHRQVERLVSTWQGRLWLHERRLRFIYDLTPEDVDAEPTACSTCGCSRTAITGGRTCWSPSAGGLGNTPTEPTPTVIHELLCLAQRSLTAPTESLHGDDEAAASLWTFAAENAEEVLVDRLAYALADAWQHR